MRISRIVRRKRENVFWRAPASVFWRCFRIVLQVLENEDFAAAFAAHSRSSRGASGMLRISAVVDGLIPGGKVMVSGVRLDPAGASGIFS